MESLLPNICQMNKTFQIAQVISKWIYKIRYTLYFLDSVCEDNFISRSIVFVYLRVKFYVF